MIFSCSGAAFFELASLPRAVRDRIIVHATPWIRPMVSVLAEYHRCCAAVVDPAQTHLWELYLGAVRDADQLQGPRLPYTRAASFQGLEEYHLRNKAETR